VTSFLTISLDNAGILPSSQQRAPIRPNAYIEFLRGRADVRRGAGSRVNGNVVLVRLECSLKLIGKIEVIAAVR
jgi:hypothetical protein